MVDPTTVAAERIPWHWQTHNVLPLLSCSRDYDNASIGGEVNTDGDRLIASIIVSLTDSDKLAIPESLKVFACQVILVADGIEIATDGLSGCIDHTVGVLVQLHESFDALGVLHTLLCDVGIIHIGNNDLTCKKS